MRTISFMSCGAALMLLIATVFAVDKKPATPAETSAKVEELAKQVDSLQARIKEMEQRLVKLEKAKDRPVLPTPLTSGSSIINPNLKALENDFADLNHLSKNWGGLENNFADPSHPPKIWGEGEFNGWKYYMIPLSTAERGAAMPIPLAGDPNTPR